VVNASDLLVGGLLPGTVAVLLLLALWQPWNRRGELRGGPAAAIALGLAFVVALLALNGRGGGDQGGWSLRRALPAFPPLSSGWLVYGTLLVTLLASISDAVRLRPAVRRRAGAVVVVLVVAAALQTRLGHLWHGIGIFEPPARAQAAWTMAIGGAGGIVYWLMLDSLAQRRSASRLALALLLTAGAGAGVISLLDSTTQGLYCGALTAGLTAIVIVGLWSGSVAASTGMLGVFAAVFIQIIVRVHVDLPDEPFGGTPLKLVLLCAAPLLTGITLIPPLRRWPARRQAAVEVATIIVVLAGILFLAKTQFDQQNTASGALALCVP